jgi:septum site-determining protein MinD
MKYLVGLMEPHYDYILIDCPAGIETGFHNAIGPANEAIVVTTPEIAAVRDADRVIGLLEANGIAKISLLVNRLRPQMVKANDMMSVADVKEILAIPLIGVIPEDECVIVSTNRGEPLVLEKKLSLPGIAFENTACRIDGQQVEFLDLQAYSKGPLKRLRNFFLGSSKTGS